MKTYLMSAPFGHMIPSLLASQKNSWNLSITLIRGSTSGFLSSSLYLCCPEFSTPEPILPEPPPLFDFLLPSLFCAGLSTQAGGGGGWIHSPLSTCLCSYLNSSRAPVSMSSSDVVLKE